MNRLFFLMVLTGMPLSVAGRLLNWSQMVLFVIYSLTIVALAAYIGRATESLAIHSGSRIGGLLNATFGNAVELIIAIFALKSGLITIVLASLTGSVIGNLLLVGGLSFFIGGLKFKRQKFNIFDARHNSALLMFGVVLAFIFPNVFSQRMDEAKTLTLSIWIAVIMIILYLALLLFKLVTHRGVYQQKKEAENDDETAEWGKWKALLVLLAATLAVAYESEHLVATFEVVGETFGWSEQFIGVIIVAMVGNTAEHASAVIMAYKDKMTTAVEIAFGSTLQIAMFIAPILVLISLFFPDTMSLVFTIPELIAMVLAVLLAITIANDGDTNWFEGLIMLAAYLIMGVGFYLL